MGLSLEAAYAECRARVRAAHSNFEAGMRLFPRDARDSVYALYAFFRHTDDLADGDGPPEQRRADLAAWRSTVDAALRGGADGWLAAVSDTARRCELPERLFAACIDACALDAGPVRMDGWAELYRYCDGVAGTVGEACLRILGYRDPLVLGLSVSNARAVQLTNILRDLADDAARDRVYLPGGFEPDEIATRPWSPAVRQGVDSAVARAEQLYGAAEPLFGLLRPAHRPPILGLTLRYRELLARLRANGFQAPAGRTSSETARLLLRVHAARWLPTWRG